MAIDGRVDMLRVRTYNGEQWLFLECQDGTVQAVARFANNRAEEAFWEWHSSRMQGILEEVLEQVVTGPTGRAKLQKIITGMEPDEEVADSGECRFCPHS